MRNRFVLVLAFFAALCFSPLAYAGGGHGHDGHDGGGDHGGDDGGHHDGEHHHGDDCSCTGGEITVFSYQETGGVNNNHHYDPSAGDSALWPWPMYLYAGAFEANAPAIPLVQIHFTGYLDSPGITVFRGLPVGTYSVCMFTSSEGFISEPVASSLGDPSHGVTVSQRIGDDPMQSRYCYQIVVADLCYKVQINEGVFGQNE